MRGSFAQTLAEVAADDPRVLLLTGDLGYMVLDVFSQRFPERFFNVGVAEQNMVGLATGLAEAGFVPFVYSIAPFASLRPYEFIRNGPILQKLPVRIVGVGGGLEYGSNGASHYGLEDVGVMRIQPGIAVVAPADHEQTRTALLDTWSWPGPVYYRLGKDDRTTIPGLRGRFDLEHAQLIRDGSDLLFISMGSIAKEVVLAADALNKRGISSAIAVVACLNPAPVQHLVRLLARFSLVFTVEAHYIVGGVGSLISEIVAENGLRCRVVRCGVRAVATAACGSEKYLLHCHKVSADALVQTVFKHLRTPKAGLASC